MDSVEPPSALECPLSLTVRGSGVVLSVDGQSSDLVDGLPGRIRRGGERVSLGEDWGISLRVV